MRSNKIKSTEVLDVLCLFGLGTVQFSVNMDNQLVIRQDRMFEYADIVLDCIVEQRRFGMSINGFREVVYWTTSAQSIDDFRKELEIAFRVLRGWSREWIESDLGYDASFMRFDHPQPEGWNDDEG